MDVTTLEGQLASLWQRLTAENPELHPVRTRMFNLVVYAGDESQADQVIAGLNALDQIHPSRTIILVANRRDRNSRVDATLALDCDERATMPSTCCHERVQLAVYGRAADHLASVVIPLLMPELPTYLWWPGQPLFGHRVFHRLLLVTDQLVVDSAQFDSPGDGLADLARLSSSPLSINDFNWARLIPWREVIAQFFDGPRFAPYALGIRSIRLEFGQGAGDSSKATASVLLLLGWMASQLGWEPETTLDRPVGEDITLAVLQRERVIPVELQFRDHGPDAGCRLMDVEVTSRPGTLAQATFRVHRSADLQTIEASTRIDGETEITRVVPLIVSDDSSLLAEELERSGKDALYDAVVNAASQMAGREVMNTT